ncbi:hypothetical protein BDZ45DRAFT_675467 [Acephala macrosclerotiorum]|nr:hypothetical protein BDZ45DRAFT_675467 [Acephala macrosclerotiorum]
MQQPGSSGSPRFVIGSLGTQVKSLQGSKPCPGPLASIALSLEDSIHQAHHPYDVQLLAGSALVPTSRTICLLSSARETWVLSFLISNSSTINNDLKTIKLFISTPISPPSRGCNATMTKELLDSDRVNYLIWRYVFPRDPLIRFFRYGIAFR